MNAKQRRISYRKLARERGFYYMIFRVHGEAIAIAQHIVGEGVSFHNSDGCFILRAYENGGGYGQIKKYTCNRISEAEATTLAEFGIPFYSNSRGIFNLDID